MIIDGKKIAGEILTELGEEIKELAKPPRLAAVLVGDNSASRKFLELKKKTAESIGLECKIYEFQEKITTQQLRKKIVEIARTKSNSGLIVELPLPKQINTQYILNALPIKKDADVLSQNAQGAFFANRSLVLPPAVDCVRVILTQSGIDLKRKNCVVFGYGLLVGKPVSHWLVQEGATVTIINEFTQSPKTFSQNADIIISGAGKLNLVKSDMVKKGAVVIDFAKDVDFENVSPVASLITPPFGGAGPIVIAAVLKNLVKLVNLTRTSTNNSL